MRRRLTVQFGSTRVAVPCGDGSNTLRDISIAAIQRYKNATNKGDDIDIRVHRLVLPEDDAILDMDDRVEDILEEGTTHIVAIFDEDDRRSNGRNGIDKEKGSNQSTSRISKQSIVEVNDLDRLPMSDLRVSSSLPIHSPISSSTSTSTSTPVRSSLRSEGVTSPTRNQRVTLSPEVTKKLDLDERREGRGTESTRLSRSVGRKSKISDSFYDAKERIEDMMASSSTSSIGPSYSLPSNLSSTVSPLLADAHSRSDSYSSFSTRPNPSNPSQTLIIFNDSRKTPMGIEVSGVQDESRIGKLASLQITSIDKNGRVGKYGELAIGDHIVELHGRPVYQMSLIRARSFLFELGNEACSTLTIDRPYESFAASTSEPSSSSLSRGETSQGSMKKPIQSALQQANTVDIVGEQQCVSITKRNGFGFTITGRETATGRHLFYVGTVKTGGAAIGILQGGDRILEVGDESTEELSQSEVVDRLKRVNEGCPINLRISRVTIPSIPSTSNIIPSSSNQNIIDNDKEKEKENIRDHYVEPGWEEMLLSIPLNNTGSAGLGVSLKARVTVKNDGSRHDCGIFVKKLLHGGAAHKDGRLRVDDRLVAIEDVDLQSKTKNAEASEAITTKLKHIGHNAHSVTLKIWRPLPNGIDGNEGESRVKDGLDDSIHVHNGGGSTPITPNVALRQLSSALDERRGTTSSVCSTTDLDESTNEIDIFDREAPTRKSISEKRGMGASTDATLTNTFQKIKHNRQTSAPPPSASFHGASGVAKRKADRIRSHSVHPRVPNDNDNDDEDDDEGRDRDRDNGEEIERIRRDTISSEKAVEEDEKKKKVIRGDPIKHSFRQAMDDTSVPWVYRSATDSPLVARRQNENREKDRERRKSMGSGLRNLFKLGKSRDEHLDKSEEFMRRREEEHRRRIEEDMRMNGMNGCPPPFPLPPTPTSMRRTVYSEYSPSTHPFPPPGSAPHPAFLIDRYDAHRYTGAMGEIMGPPPSGHAHYVYGPPPSRIGWTNGGYGGPPDYYSAFNAWFAYSSNGRGEESRGRSRGMEGGERKRGEERFTRIPYH